MHHQAKDQRLLDCIESCKDCLEICMTTVDYCLQQGGTHAMAGHLRLLQNCADICEGSMKFMLRGSNLYKKLCGFCAEVCDGCADACERFTGDQQMHACASACRSCSGACRAV